MIQKDIIGLALVVIVAEKHPILRAASRLGARWTYGVRLACCCAPSR